jgi:hypothetical protein
MKDSEPKDRLPVLGPRFLDPDDDLTIYARNKNWEIFSPDWDYLREFPTFELAPLCALSVGLIPQLAVPSWVFCVALPHFDGSKRDECSCPAEPDEEAENERGAAVLREFIRRVHIAPANLAPLGELPIAAGEANAERTRVRVADFAAWAKGKGWTLHPEFSTVATAKSKTAENPYISKAPPPITPVRGGGCSSRRRPATIRPDWQEWAMVDFVTAEDAAALLLNLEPRSIKTWESCTFPDDATFDKLHMRLRIIEAVPWRTRSWDYSGIPLPCLATWAISKGMEIPDELRALARPLPELAPASEPKTDTAPVVSGESAEQIGTAHSGATEHAASKSAPIGISKREILSVDWPLPAGAPTLQKIIDSLPKWVDEACTKVGRVGKGVNGSHLWNPAILAFCLATKTPQKQWAVGKGALTHVLRLSFPDYLEQWEEAAKSL